jgi:hypothetical protein
MVKSWVAAAATILPPVIFRSFLIVLMSVGRVRGGRAEHHEREPDNRVGRAEHLRDRYCPKE